MEYLALKDIFARMLRHKEEDPLPSGSLTDATILVVDDSRTSVHVIKSIVETAGYQTLTAMDGVQAVDTAKARLPDLILMDIVMPNMNGFEATRILAQDTRTAGIPIIIVSGTDQPTERAWSGRVGAKGYLTKPVHQDLLLSSIARVLTLSRNTQAKRETEQPATSDSDNV